MMNENVIPPNELTDEELEDLLDLEDGRRAKESYEDYLRTGISYTVEEVRAMLNISDDDDYSEDICAAEAS